MTGSGPLPYCSNPDLGGPGRRAFSDEEEQVIARTYQEGMWTHDTISEAVGISASTIRNILRRQGVTSKRGTRGERHRSWKGGNTINADGYAMTWLPDDHPFVMMRQSKGYVLTHRLRMAEHLGRPLRPDETVHHIDGDKLNNEVSNLQLRTGHHGSGVIRRCLDCGSVNTESVPLD